MTWFLILKSLHVLSAVIAIGANATYGIWSARGKNDSAHLGFVLRGIKVIDDRMANPAYGVLLITGLIMTFTTYNFSRTWILIGLGGYIVLAVVGVGVYSPALNRQISLLESDGPGSATYRAADARARGAGIFLAVLVVATVFVMVIKPQL